MKLEIKTFTVQEVIDAIALNGLEHIRSNWIHVSDGVIVAACVLSQGAVNLGVLATSDYGVLVDMGLDPVGDTMDGAQQPYLVNQLNKFPVNRTDFPNAWYRHMHGDSAAGSVIVALNDAVIRRNVSRHLIHVLDAEKNIEVEYLLPTYEDVVNMVKIVLSPFATETITLQVLDYTPLLKVQNNA